MIHILPFDTGFIFTDKLNILDKKQRELLNEYRRLLKEKFGENVFCETGDKIVFQDKHCREIVFKIAVSDGVAVYIQPTGIGTIVVENNNWGGELEPELRGMQLLKIKDKYENMLLGKEDAGVLIEIKREVDFVRGTIYEISKALSEKYKEYFIRSVSSDVTYGNDGFGYCFTIMTEVPSNIGKADIADFVSGKCGETCDLKSVSLELKECDMYFSWFGIWVARKENRDSQEMLDTLVQAENYLQAKWFLASVVGDNMTMSGQMSLEKILKQKGSLELINIELKNKSHAGMMQVYKKMMELGIATSDITQMYASAIEYLGMYEKVLTAKNEGKKRKFMLFQNSLFAFFTGFTLYKAIMEMTRENFSKVKLGVFLFFLFLSIGIVVIQYIYNNKK